MNAIRFRILLVFLAAMVCASVAMSQTYLLRWSTMSNGGRPSSGTGYASNATVAQPVTGKSTGTGYQGYWGFWNGWSTHDVGAIAIKVPTGTLDSGTVIVPACSVYNYGINAESYTVRMRLGAPSFGPMSKSQEAKGPIVNGKRPGVKGQAAPSGSDAPFHDKTVSVSAHASGTPLYVTFPPCTLRVAGTHPVCCSTQLAADEVRANDKFVSSITVVSPIQDVRCRILLAPSGTVDSGTSVTPACSTENLSTNATLTYTVRMRIGSGYDTFATVTNQAPGAKTRVTFPTWKALPRGTLTVKCSTQLAGDGNPANDWKSGSVFVRVHDVAVDTILVPLGRVDSGAVRTPQAQVHNYGNVTDTFKTILSITPAYADTKTVILAGSGTTTLSFKSWTAKPRGSQTVKCTTVLATDKRSSNNVKRGTVTVRVADAGVLSIELPVPGATYDS
ncbi:MAG: hypothetical protein ABIK62_04525, partial [candidate division WOR-3 bacterium]